MSSTIYQNYIKRVLDFVFALLLLILLSPLLLVVTIWLHFANKGAGAFFTQERPGKDEKIFRLYRFKSMTDERDVEGIIEHNSFGNRCHEDCTDVFSRAIDLFIKNRDQLLNWGMIRLCLTSQPTDRLPLPAGGCLARHPGHV